MSANQVAVRYAKAFIGALREKNALGEASSFLDFCKLAADNQELASLFANVTVSAAHKAAVVVALAEKLGLSKLVASFLRVLANAGRLNILSYVGDAVAAQLDNINNVQSVELTTASAPSDAEVNQFAESMKKLLGSDVRVTSKVEPSILGGAVARVGSVVYDGSVRAQLDRLHAELVKEN